MTLVHSLFATNSRLQRAANNSPPLRRGDSGDAVALIQQALVSLGQSLPLSTQPDGSMDGDFAGETVRALKAFQRAETLVDDHGSHDGVAGSRTLHRMDARLIAAGSAARPTVLATPAGPVPQLEDPAQVVPIRFQINRVTGAALFAAYQDMADSPNGSLQCRRGRGGAGGTLVGNQCAVRLSLALADCRAGFDFSQGGAVANLHSGHRNCGGIAPHITGSFEMATYLNSIPGFNFTIHRKERNDRTAGRAVYDGCAGSHGIVFFHHLDAPTPGSGSAGNHIDYVRQGICMNEHFDFAARGEPGQTERYFRQCADVWFFTIPSG
jgi:hypothetical protein